MSRSFLALLLFMFLTKISVNGQLEEWCIADEQTPDTELQVALDWACGKGGADCSKIQKDQSCYYPNTVRDHASYAFNNYFQKYKKKGGTCFFNNAAMVIQVDPSHNSCHYEYMP
ncbi:hypothetical protein MTR67_032213 [Solanum verrucosum]|uniref:X8 domain-containing protein n=1 Tax=Solanum verrucosum TaxID=315347 RepID=A0AAF0U3W2_SOLVR|nr:glucan endo-1,3-beta-glucosidase 12-like [Solanum verrucosum]XP_049412685.1 glucan endo-1,3-beta-glucosidase 12-like [Solanum stenotomum]KAH0653365.1 hypothetical protein KY289_031043 [Solanum tuberosum]WMV38828.1 hypothetical protein MTR67_032213 [Solanum verrucosum]